MCVLGWRADFREDVQRLCVSLRGDCQCHRVQVRAARRQVLFLLGGVGLEQRHEEQGQKEGHHKERSMGRMCVVPFRGIQAPVVAPVLGDWLPLSIRPRFLVQYPLCV